VFSHIILTLFTRFFLGGTVHGAWSVGFILMSELSVVSKRGLVAGILNGGGQLQKNLDFP
jgi:hypothetical protein